MRKVSVFARLQNDMPSVSGTQLLKVFSKKSVFLEAIKAETHLKQGAFSKERITLRA